MNMDNTQDILLPDQIADLGEQLYKELFRSEYEESHKDKFLAIDVVNKKAYLGDHPEDALDKANQSAPDGTFYLVRIGNPTTFNVGYIGEQETELDWSTRQIPHSLAKLQPA